MIRLDPGSVHKCHQSRLRGLRTPNESDQLRIPPAAKNGRLLRKKNPVLKFKNIKLLMLIKYKNKFGPLGFGRQGKTLLITSVSGCVANCFNEFV